MPTANVGASIAQAGLNIQKRFEERPLRDARLKEAQMRQERSEMELQEYKRNAPNRQMKEDMEIKLLQEQLAQIERESFRQLTHDHLRRYDIDGNIDHLNNFLKESKKRPQGAVFQDTVRFRPLEDTEELRNQAKSEYGISDYDGLLNSDMHNFVVASMDDGKDKLVDLDGLYMFTGFNPIGEQQELYQKRMKYKQMAAYGIPFEAMDDMERIAIRIQQETGEPFSEIYARISKKGGNSQIERLADELQVQNPGMSRVEAMRQAYGMRERKTEKERLAAELRAEDPSLSVSESMVMAKNKLETRTAAQKNLENAQDVRDQLNAMGGEDGDFFTVDLKDEQTRRQAGALMTDYMKYTGQSLDRDQRNRLINIRKLTALGGKVGEDLSGEEIGFLDNTLHTIKKYFDNDITGTGGTAAYGSFRNIIRNALFGATLTPTEIAAFNEAMGTLKQQEGPALQQMKIQMESLATELQALYDMGDPYVMYYMTGKSAEDLDAAIFQLQERVDLITKRDAYTTMVPDRKPGATGNVPDDPAARKETLERILPKID